jgi:hypothetical protein
VAAGQVDGECAWRFGVEDDGERLRPSRTPTLDAPMAGRRQWQF